MFVGKFDIQRDVFFADKLQPCHLEIGMRYGRHSFLLVDLRGNPYSGEAETPSELLSLWVDAVTNIGYPKGVTPYDFFSTLFREYKSDYTSDEKRPFPENFHICC